MVFMTCLPLHLQDGQTAFFIACRKGHNQIVELLLRREADVNHQTKVRLLMSSMCILHYCTSCVSILVGGIHHRRANLSRIQSLYWHRDQHRPLIQVHPKVMTKQQRIHDVTVLIWTHVWAVATGMLYHIVVDTTCNNSLWFVQCQEYL